MSRQKDMHACLQNGRACLCGNNSTYTLKSRERMDAAALFGYHENILASKSPRLRSARARTMS